MSDIHTCGFCDIVTGLLRRVMCVGNRRGSSESYYRELADQDTLRFDDHASERSVGSDRLEELVPVDFAEDDHTGVPITLELIKDSFKAPWSLEGIPTPLVYTNMERRRALGRFHSMQRLNVKKSSSCTTDLEALLDSSYPNKVQLLFERHLHQWDFDTQILNLASGDRVLPILCMHLFKFYNLINHFGLDEEKCMKLFQIIDEAYHAKNPYHNAVHAADVTQAVHCFLQQDKLRKHLLPLEIMMLLLAAITHDLDHPGVNHNYITKTEHALFHIYKAKAKNNREFPEKKKKDRKLEELLEDLRKTTKAIQRGEIPKLRATLADRFRKHFDESENVGVNTEPSILEHHHWRVAYSCILESGIFDHMQHSLPYIRRTLGSLILATDITRQNDYLDVFKRHVKRNTLDMSRPDHRHMALQMALKTADISNPGRSWLISKKWSMSVCDEFFFQGDKERQCNLEISQLCDRNKESVPEIQIGFFKFVVSPLFKEWSTWLHTSLTHNMVRNLLFNQFKWELEALRYSYRKDFPLWNAKALRQALASASKLEQTIQKTTSISESSANKKKGGAPQTTTKTTGLYTKKPSPATQDPISSATKRRLSSRAPSHERPPSYERPSSYERATSGSRSTATNVITDADMVEYDLQTHTYTNSEFSIAFDSSAEQSRRASLSLDLPNSNTIDGTRRFSAPLQVSHEPRTRSRGKKDSIPECILAEEVQGSVQDISEARAVSQMSKIAPFTNSDVSLFSNQSVRQVSESSEEHLINFDVLPPKPIDLQVHTVQVECDVESDEKEAQVADDNTGSAEDSSGSQRALNLNLNSQLQGLLASFSSNTNSSESRLYQSMKEDKPSAMQKTDSERVLLDMLFPRVLKQAWERRRGSAPATSDVRPIASNMSLHHNLGDNLKPRHQWVPKAELPISQGRRSSLPVEVITGRACIPA